jgi:hypothetical protein
MAPSETHLSHSAAHEPAAKKLKTVEVKDSHVNGSGSVKVTSAQTMEMENKYSAHNYHPLPVVFARALGSKVWDPEGKEYLDFLCACTGPLLSGGLTDRFCCESGPLSSQDCTGADRSSEQAYVELTRFLQ